ncbi:MAG: DUF4252 domain-containing protein [Muribaculaceae bacterium]|nr:DUF4252 domain-containing protein [Muribaculaceae bacterium]
MKTIKYLLIAIAIISTTIQAKGQDTIYVDWSELESLEGLEGLGLNSSYKLQFDTIKMASLEQYNELASRLQEYYIASKFPPTFEPISNYKGVTSVYISSAMLKNFGSSMIGDPRISSIAGNLNSIEIIKCDNKKFVYTIRNYVKKIAEGYGLETLARINDEGEKVSIYGLSSGEKITYVLMCVDDDDEITIISMSGEIPLDKVGELVNSKK